MFLLTRNAKKTEDKIESLEKELEDTKEGVEKLEKEFKDLEENATTIMQEHKKAQVTEWLIVQRTDIYLVYWSSGTFMNHLLTCRKYIGK